MPQICYVDTNFRAGSLAIIDQANAIINEYARQGFDLTLRQLYYQFVARALIPNKQTEYKRLGSIVNDARLVGLIDWDRIEDRTRELKEQSHWDSPAAIVESCAHQYLEDKWALQPSRVEVWIEKDALTGVIDGVCTGFDVPYFSCRGYVSQSEMWGASQRLDRYIRTGQEVVLLHLGDHDPSGIDMTRDIRDRLCLFLEHEGHDYGSDFRIERIALTMAQVRKHKPPPNPTKLTDARAPGYLKKFGNESWELDALDPATLARLITKHVEAVRDEAKWEDAETEEEENRERLKTVAADLSCT